MKINSLTKTKIRLFMSLITNVVVVSIIAIAIYFVLALFFENNISVFIANLNYEVYSWIVHNRDIVLYVYIVVVLLVITYRFISKYIDDINQVYNSLDLILKEDNTTIKLPDNVSQFTEKLNDIKYNYIASKNRERDASQKKNDLIMYMAHDLKTPLTSVIGYLTLLSDEKGISKELQEKYTKIALTKALRLEELTNQFFDITRYDLHTMVINKNEINIAYLLEQLVDECYPMLEKNSLKCKLDTPAKVMYVGDGDKLARAFGNLLKNAINYSYKNTTIEIKLEQVDDKIRVSFKNKGDKIPEYKLNKIFEKFYRGDDSRASSTGGAGLGLAITKEIVELHRGTIKVKNDDEYIEFVIELNV